jgi:hypothetical protein
MLDIRDWPGTLPDGSREDRSIGRSHRRRLPAGNGPGAVPRLCVVANAGRAQFDRSRQLAATLEGSADRSGIRLGDDEHRRSMGTRASGGKPVPPLCDPWVTPHLSE